MPWDLLDKPRDEDGWIPESEMRKAPRSSSNLRRGGKFIKYLNWRKKW
jgi:hypothetical protein